MNNNSYMITAEEIEKLESIRDYFDYHNKNLTKNQDYMLYIFDNIIDHLRDRYTGKADKNTEYLKEL